MSLGVLMFIKYIFTIVRYPSFLSFIYIFFPTVQHGDPVTLACMHCFFSHDVLHYNCLDRVPSATQQDPIANPSQGQHSASIYPKLPVLPLPSLPPWQPKVYSANP